MHGTVHYILKSINDGKQFVTVLNLMRYCLVIQMDHYDTLLRQRKMFVI
jgi:hypothetical protein